MAGKGWKSVTIQSLIDDGVITAHKDGNYGSNYPRKHEFGEVGVPLLTAKLLDDGGRVDIEAAPRLAIEKANKLTYGFIESGDVLLSHNATIGRVAVTPPLKERVLVGTSLTYFRVNHERLLPRYLAAFFSGRDFQNQLIAVMSHSTRNQVPITAQRLLSIVFPPLAEQKAIAHILGSLDEKIELNRRMNETLESAARALFKSWFVDFDPVRAKVDGRTPSGMDEATARLFPSAFADSELGKIPQGWSVEPLGNYLDVLETGRRPKGGVSKYKTGIPSVGAESIHGIGNFDYSKTKYVPQEFFETMSAGKVEDFDVLLYKDGGKPGEFKPRIGMFGMGFPFTQFGINEHVFRVRSSELGQAFLYFQTGCERIFHDLAVRGGKAAIPGINQQEVKSLDFLIPPSSITRSFNDTCQSMFENILHGSIQSQTLASLRDELLPKLLSGEIRVGEAAQRIENTVEAVA